MIVLTPSANNNDVQGVNCLELGIRVIMDGRGTSENKNAELVSIIRFHCACLHAARRALDPGHTDLHETAGQAVWSWTASRASLRTTSNN